MPDCPDCGKYLAEGKWLCLCGYRLKPKEPPKPKYSCRKCDYTKFLHRCGPEESSYYLCSTCYREAKENAEEAKEERIAIQAESEDSKRDFLQDKADGVIK